jgi:hypothetical protein
VAVSDRPIPLAPLQHLAAAALRREYPAMVEAMVGWRPIETAPKDGTYVLLFFPSRPISDTFTGIVRSGCWGYVEDDDDSDGWYEHPEDDMTQRAGDGLPTHWMPLPDPPK